MIIWYTAIFVIYTHCWCVVVVFFFQSRLNIKEQVQFFFSVRCSHKCGINYTCLVQLLLSTWWTKNRNVKFFTVFFYWKNERRSRAKSKRKVRRSRAGELWNSERSVVCCRIHDWLTGGKLYVYPQKTLNFIRYQI